jgi:very-short-patch-repair endonuclease
LLREAGFRCRYERVFGGRYSVDAYVPSRKIAFEADCHWGHEEKRESGQEEARDAYLMAEHGLLAVIHLTKEDLRPFLTS